MTSLELPRAATVAARVPRPLRLPSFGLLFAAGLGVLVVMPFAMAVLVSLMPADQVMGRGFVPWPLTLDAYRAVWTKAPFLLYVVNSVIVCVAITGAVMLTSVLAAFVFARAAFPGRELLFLSCVATLMIPSHMTLIPNYLMIAKAGLLDTLWGLIVPYLAHGFAIFFLRQHFKSIPQDVIDAARLDGASAWRILWNIVVPMSRPAVAAVALWVFLDQWNNYIWPLIATDREAVRTVQIGLARLFEDESESGLVNWPLVMAGSILVLIPTFVAFLLAERHLVRGITVGSLK
jgi:ABC-type glycerol-3-phosphate transport system permease component